MDEPFSPGQSDSALRASLGDALRRARAHTLELVADLHDEGWLGPQLAIVNPALWEVGHVGWFQEFFVLRELWGEAKSRDDADALWDSMAVLHDTRWQLPLPTPEETRTYLTDVLDRVLARLGREQLDASAAWRHGLVLFHEDMHAEAFTYTRQTLGLGLPRLSCLEPAAEERNASTAPDLSGDVEFAGGSYHLGATGHEAFVFDNEQCGHTVELAPFRMARTPVTRGAFAEFVDAGGYADDSQWDAEGRAWRDAEGVAAPLTWRRAADGSWCERGFDREQPLDELAPMMHVSWHEARAYCRWADRRLPTEAEWEFAATGSNDGARPKPRFPWGDAPTDVERAHTDTRSTCPKPVGACAAGDTPDGLRQMLGNVWEWTESPFEPYPGFAPGPYVDYSAPWFGTRKVLRGGSFATPARMLRNTWRNFFTPDRRDVFAGFRTCAE